MRVRITRRAALDIRLQIDWLTERSPRSAAKAVSLILDAVSLLSRHPLSGREIDIGLRETQVRFGLSGFVIRYQVRQHEVIVKRVFHGAQDRSSP